MNPICPLSDKVCFACYLPCNPPAINPLAVDVPEEREPFRGILPSFLESLTKKVNIEADLQEETVKATITIPL